MRRNLYLSDKRDTDILDELDLENIPDRDFSYEVRKLLRDGIKWRQYEQSNEVEFVPLPSRKQNNENKKHHAKEEEQPENKVDFELKKKELSDEEIDSKFDNI